MQSHAFAGPAGRLHYLADPSPGAKPPLVLLAGLTCHARYWAGIWPLLAADFDLYALDWRGHGDSEPAASYGFADYQADLAAFLAHLDRPDALVVGHSLGGYVALQRAAQGSPPRAVVACDVKTSITPEELEGGRKAAGKPQQALPDLAEAARRLRAGLADGDVTDEVVAELARHGTRPHPEGGVAFKFDRRALALEPLDPFAFAPRVATPVLVLHGANSRVMNAEAAQALAAALPDATHQTLPAAGHHAYLDAPQAFAAAVRAFARA